MERIDSFIKDAIVLLDAALVSEDLKLKWAVLKNLSDVVESYVEAIENELELI